ncbi:ABC transporter ATP-binding protein [uncultured Alsobacter sp.]|uniref:ABC transporter ATP-binding protein n=1 Tax=uncultured Alsobacter sp. TaxID=1748258 RepID=UPI0025CB9E15|nr:ATP-binding cassette domain-containing protein [uncultured Alsobacter sp.]
MPASTAEAALTIRNLWIRDREGGVLVRNVSLSLPRGGVLTLIGETGSGKSLIAQALFGMLPEGLKVEGTIHLAGQPPIPAGDARQLAALWRSTLALVPQEPARAFDPTMTVGRQMALAGMGEGEVASSLRTFDLPEAVGRAYPFALSGGMAQRVLVAWALGLGSPVVVADEPTKGLDADRVTQAVSALAALARAGRSLLVITHDRRVAEDLPGTLAILRDGEIVEQGESTAVLAAPVSDYARTWLDADPRHWPRCLRCCDMSSLALSAHGLAFAWPGQAPLFRAVDLHLPRGGVLAVAGPSGSGKSTLGDILLGIRRPSAGSVEWSGVDIVADPSAIRPRRQRYQKLHQDPASTFVPHLPLARQFLALREVRPGLAIEREMPPLLERLKVRPSLLGRRPGEISGGEAQRLALARILLLDPVAIVADEPTSRLDPVVQRETMSLLRSIVDQRGLGLVLIGHDRAMLRAIADDRLELGIAERAASSSRLA